MTCAPSLPLPYQTPCTLAPFSNLTTVRFVRRPFPGRVCRTEHVSVATTLNSCLYFPCPCMPMLQSVTIPGRSATRSTTSSSSRPRTGRPRCTQRDCKQQPRTRHPWTAPLLTISLQYQVGLPFFQIEGTVRRAWGFNRTILILAAHSQPHTLTLLRSWNGTSAPPPLPSPPLLTRPVANRVLTFFCFLVRRVRFDVRLMQRVPYEGVSRMQTSLRRKHRDRVVRR